jgi:hypothetical protein
MACERQNVTWHAHKVEPSPWQCPPSNRNSSQQDDTVKAKVYQFENNKPWFLLCRNQKVKPICTNWWTLSPNLFCTGMKNLEYCWDISLNHMLEKQGVLPVTTFLTDIHVRVIRMLYKPFKLLAEHHIYIFQIIREDLTFVNQMRTRCTCI